MSIQIKSKNKEELVSGFLLEKTAKLMKLHFSRSLLLYPQIDITVDQWIILDLIKERQIINQQQLAELSLKDAPTVTRILDILEEKNLISRKVNPDDRRKFNISLRPKGQKTYEMMWPIVQEFRADCYNNLTKEELLLFAEVLAKIHVKLVQNN
ncbi:MAG: MarR family transcriptional regulator [Saprospiraceae bacterium]